ncbi:MAG TPA: hypothetical protein VGA30_05785, partial [Actinomycetota bacterium]
MTLSRRAARAEVPLALDYHADMEPTEPAVAYPEHRVADVVLRDGSTVRVRPVRRDDEDAVRAFLESLSLRSRYFR